MQATPSPAAVRPAVVAPPHAANVVVFTYKRLPGLTRLLDSLAAAFYAGHNVSMTIFLDYPKKTFGPDDGTREFVANYHWPHGPLRVHRRVANAGLKRTIMEAWFPSAATNEATAFFEDDIEVSPYWYLWAMAALATYASPTAAVDPRMLGVSLFRPIHDELSGHGCKVTNGFQAFALQQPCSWGALYLPGPWRAFRDWYDQFAADADADPRVATNEGKRPSSNEWDRHSSWKKYLIKLMHERGWYMIYPNAPGDTVLATNHLMKGEHPTPPRKLFELPLMKPQSPEIVTWVGAKNAEDLASALTAQASAFTGTLPSRDKLEVYDVMFDRVPNLEALQTR
jgi:hypothetical protein